MRWKFEKFCGSSIQLNIIGTGLKISMTSFVIFINSKRGTLFDVLRGIFIFILPNSIVLILFVASVNAFGNQVIGLILYIGFFPLN